MQQNQKLIIDIHELADLLGLSRQAILRYRCGGNHPLLAGLPEPVMTKPRLRWWRADIDAWIDSRRTYRPTEEPAEKPAGGRERGLKKSA